MWTSLLSGKVLWISLSTRQRVEVVFPFLLRDRLLTRRSTGDDEAVLVDDDDDSLVSGGFSSVCPAAPCPFCVTSMRASCVQTAVMSRKETSR